MVRPRPGSPPSPTSPSVRREHVKARISSLEFQLTSMETRWSRAARREHAAKSERIRELLREAMRYVDEDWSSWRFRRKAASLEGAWSNLRTAEVKILDLMGPEDIECRSVEIYAKAKRHLDKRDARLAELDMYFNKRKWCRERKWCGGGRQEPCDRRMITSALEAAYEAEDVELAKVRGLRRSLWLASVFAFIVLAVFVAWMQFHPHELALCFRPKENFVACPSREVVLKGPYIWPVELTTGWESSEDSTAVVIAGFAGASLTAIATLRKLPRSNSPYDLTVPVASLKFLTGGLTALIGILLIHGGFIPGLTNLDTTAQILAWAVVFGAAQHVATRFIDDEALRVLTRAGKTGVPTE